MAILTIPAASSPISAELSLIPVALLPIPVALLPSPVALSQGSTTAIPPLIDNGVVTIVCYTAPQMCNRLTKHGDVGTFSRPVLCHG